MTRAVTKPVSETVAEAVAEAEELPNPGLEVATTKITSMNLTSTETCTIDKPAMSIQDCIARLLNNGNVKMADLHYDIIRNIFEHGDMCTSVCLGLTCTKLYAFLKTKYPHPIPLYQISCTTLPTSPWLEELGVPTEEIENIVLSSLLEHWAGPRYQVITLKIPPRTIQYFRDVRIFGKGTQLSKAELHLQMMYRDCEKVSETPPGEDYVDQRTEIHLPLPQNKDREEWDRGVVAAITDSIALFKSVDHWHDYFSSLNLHVWWRHAKLFFEMTGQEWDDYDIEAEEMMTAADLWEANPTPEGPINMKPSFDDPISFW